ncbi:unnamed protein product [Victoria cruziana]
MIFATLDNRKLNRAPISLPSRKCILLLGQRSFFICFSFPYLQAVCGCEETGLLALHGLAIPAARDATVLPGT